MNDRIGFQYASIVSSHSGEDVLQPVLDSELTLSDTQVEIGLDMNSLFTQSATVANVQSLLSDSYSLILPNRKGLEDGEVGFMMFQNDTGYLSNLKSFGTQDMFQQNGRDRYPRNTIRASFQTLEHVRTLFGITQFDARLTALEQAIQTIEQNFSTLQQEQQKHSDALKFHHAYTEKLWFTTYGNPLFAEGHTNCSHGDLHDFLPEI